MDELISKQKVIDKLDEALERITKNVSKESDAYHIVYGTVDITKCMIMTIQPKRGKWNRLDMDTLNCNKCGATFVLNQGSEKMHFCPNCGADMREVTT